MCGLTALLALKGSDGLIRNQYSSRELLARDIDSSLEIVKHRGPDAQGSWLGADRDVALGHVRLSIIDLSPDGNQPFHDLEDGIHAVVNGELYDHDRYRAKLASEFNFVGQSDCEIVIALYKHYGLSMLSHLRGEFAFVLWDAKRQLLFAARDRYGIKSLYYTIVDGRLLVATEMKSFLAFGWKPEWDVQSLRDGGWRVDARTIFRGVRKVLPGHYLISKRHELPEDFVYWDHNYPDKHAEETRSEEEMILGVRERLLEAVRLRLRADVPVGIYLSGGLDSSAVAGMVAHLIREGTKIGDDTSQDLSRMRVFTVQFDKASGADESDIAERTAEWLGCKYQPIALDEDAMAAGLEDATWFSETATPDTNGIGRMAMAEKMHALGMKVVLTGEGSDEHFGGYSSYHCDVLREPDYSWPASLISEAERRQAQMEAEARPSFVFSDNTFDSRVDSTMRMMNNTYQSFRANFFDSYKFATWTEKAFPDINGETTIAESFDGQVRDNIANKWHPLHTSEYVWTKGTFANILLRWTGDNMDMVHHVESRTPFLDHHVTEYADGLPPSLKIKYDPVAKKFNEKYILKEAMRPFITDEIYARVKHPFIGPSKFEEGGPLHKKLAKLVTKENMDALGFADWEQSKDLLHRAFVKREGVAFRMAMGMAQLVVLSKRFGVRKAEPEASTNGTSSHSHQKTGAAVMNRSA